MKLWNVLKNDESEAEIRIEGEIKENQSFWAMLFGENEQLAKDVREQIAEFNGKPLTVWINSEGGECIAASVMYTALMEHKGGTVVKVDGKAISAASVVAMAGEKVLMSPTAVMMIHNPLTAVEGEVKDMEKAIRVLKEVKETILNAYCNKCKKKTRNEIAKMMDEETWMSAQKAIDLGFADGILYSDGQVDLPGVVTDELVSGARTVYNNMPKYGEDIIRAIKEHQHDWSADEMQIGLEKNRFTEVQK